MIKAHPDQYTFSFHGQEKSPLVFLPDAGRILECLRGLPPCGLMLISSPPRCGVSSSILSAIQRTDEFPRVEIYTSCIQEDVPKKSVLALGLHLGCLQGGRDTEKVTLKEMMLAIRNAIRGRDLDVLVFEHLEFEDPDFQRAILAINRELLKEGGRTRFLIHFTGRRKFCIKIDPDLEANLTFSLDHEVPDPVRIFSIFCLNLVNQPRRVMEFVGCVPRSAPVNEFLLRIVELAEGDMVYAVNMAQRINYLFGDLEVNESYFEKINSYLAEKEQSPLYKGKR